ncbi:hypothetical protein B0J12DRAFT_404907 [Macrophomina phaseolina]|uniref:Uncharacterized protein n=1 Tax=Macrophomina phaseolina TaxID=35725 RepID=A0ABQ8GIP7_9PEZI|nr:hypothetical protein B0J12DRAFT_404907 [Macrophomina phaseolina]
MTPAVRLRPFACVLFSGATNKAHRGSVAGPAGRACSRARGHGSQRSLTDTARLSYAPGVRLLARRASTGAGRPWWASNPCFPTCAGRRAQARQGIRAGSSSYNGRPFAGAHRLSRCHFERSVALLPSPSAQPRLFTLGPFWLPTPALVCTPDAAASLNCLCERSTSSRFLSLQLPHLGAFSPPASELLLRPSFLILRPYLHPGPAVTPAASHSVGLQESHVSTRKTRRKPAVSAGHNPTTTANRHTTLHHTTPHPPDCFV